MFRSVSQQNTTNSNQIPHPSNPVLSSSDIMSNPRRPQLSHSQTLSSLPDAHKRRPRPSPAGSFLTSFFATFTPSSGTSGAPSPTIKSHRSEAELRRDYLSPEREKEIGEIWDQFKRQSQDINDDKLTSFPPITEYEYEDQEDDELRRDTRRTVRA
jgi:hypothetical protein